VGRLHLDTLSLGARLVSVHVEEGWDRLASDLHHSTV